MDSTSGTSRRLNHRPPIFPVAMCGPAAVDNFSFAPMIWKSTIRLLRAASPVPDAVQRAGTPERREEGSP